ncbi:MAG: hypothetical protein AAGA03_18175, partial [Planctomycetota bacterium]
ARTPYGTRPHQDAGEMKAILLKDISTMRSACRNGKVHEAAATLLTPMEFENALLQGDLVEQFTRKETCERMDEFLADASIHELDADAGTVLLRSPRDRSREYSLAWFDGHWYLVD